MNLYYCLGTASSDVGKFNSHCAMWRCEQCNYCVWYSKGHGEPHYPMPAIRQYYEFGWSLSTSEPVLLHVVQGTYEG